MAVFQFIVKEDDGVWNAKQYKKEGDAELSAEASSTWELGRKLVQLALESAGPGGVSSFFSYTTPKSGVYEVIVGGGSIAIGGGGGGGAASGGAADSGAAEEAKEEEKKEEEKEESDDDMGFSLFD